jgi:hypothetical protein
LLRLTRRQLKLTVIVAVVAVGMVQMAVDQVIDMVAVRDGRMSAAGTMHMGRVVPAARMRRSASVGVAFRHAEGMLLHGPASGLMVQMTIVQVVYMPIMLHGDVTAAGTMLMGVVGVKLLGG